MNSVNTSVTHNNRNNIIDILKGIGIIMITGGHCDAPFRFLYSVFHVAIFILASGFFYKEENTDSFGLTIKYFIKKFKALWLPYFLGITIFTLTHNLQYNLGIITSDTRVFEYSINAYSYEMISNIWGIKEMLKSIVRAFFLGGGVSFAGNFWFLRVLLMVTLLYNGISWLVKRFFKTSMISQTVVSLLFLAAGFMLQKKGLELYGIASTLSCYSLYHIGTFIGYYYRNKVTEKENKLYGVMALSVIIILLIDIRRVEIFELSLNINKYPDPIFLIVASVAGWFTMCLISGLINKVSGIREFLVVCGKNSLLIMILHPICFKIINAIQVELYDLPHYALASYPVIFSSGLWWMGYMCVGVLVPLAFAFLWKILTNGDENT